MLVDSCVLVPRSESLQVNTAPLTHSCRSALFFYSLLQSWKCLHVDFCAGGGRFRKTHWYVIRSLWNTIMSLSALSFCLQSLHLRWSTTSALEKSRQQKSALVVNQHASLHCCLCLGLLTIQCDEHHRIQTFMSCHLMLGFRIYNYPYVMGWWWDLLCRSRRR